MDITDILYTPLDIPPLPQFDISDIKAWIAKNQSQEVSHEKDASQLLGNRYPWNIVYARQDTQWLNGFSQQFPELAKFFYEAFGLDENDLEVVCFLPLRTDFEGIGFWHADPDESGLRLYLENSDAENADLLIKPTTKKFNSRKELGVIPRTGICDKVQQDVMHTVVPVPGPQANFLNNINAVHAVNTANLGIFFFLVLTACSQY